MYGDINPLLGYRHLRQLIDDDCDALIDEGVQTTFYRRLDGVVAMAACSFTATPMAPCGRIPIATVRLRKLGAACPAECVTSLYDDCDG